MRRHANIPGQRIGCVAGDLHMIDYIHSFFMPHTRVLHSQRESEQNPSANPGTVDRAGTKRLAYSLPNLPRVRDIVLKRAPPCLPSKREQIYITMITCDDSELDSYAHVAVKVSTNGR